MQRARHLVGMVVRTTQGAPVGEVRDVLLDPTARRVVGLAVAAGPILRRPRYVRRADIVDISSDGVTVKDAECLMARSIGGHGLSSEVSPIGRIVERTGVGDLGHVRDVLVDANRLSVWGFEISDGLVSDVLNGVTHLPRREVQRLAGRLVWSPAHDADHMITEDDGKPTPGGGEHQ